MTDLFALAMLSSTPCSSCARAEAASNFVRRLLDPEDLGHAVTAEVRQLAREALDALQPAHIEALEYRNGAFHGRVFPTAAGQFRYGVEHHGTEIRGGAGYADAHEAFVDMVDAVLEYAR